MDMFKALAEGQDAMSDRLERVEQRLERLEKIYTKILPMELTIQEHSHILIDHRKKLRFLEKKAV